MSQPLISSEQSTRAAAFLASSEQSVCLPPTPAACRRRLFALWIYVFTGCRRTRRIKEKFEISKVNTFCFSYCLNCHCVCVCVRSVSFHFVLIKITCSKLLISPRKWRWPVAREFRVERGVGVGGGGGRRRFPFYKTNKTWQQHVATPESGAHCRSQQQSW